MNLETLNTELTTDPLGRGYSGMSDVEAADSLNARDRQPNRESITGGMLVASLVASEYVSLTADAKDYIRMIVSADSIPLTDSLKTQLGNIFPGGSTTRANILALTKRPGSRWEELGLEPVTPSDVANARRL